MKIMISATKGAGMSLIRGLLTNNVHVDTLYGTCHQSWETPNHESKHTVWSSHDHGANFEGDIVPDITVGIWINSKNLIQICQRLVIVDFQYAQDATWQAKQWAWHKGKHDQLAGPDWPPYSTDITKYPEWCRNEMCQVAYNRSKYWTHSDLPYDYIIDSDELFGDSNPVTLQKLFNAVDMPLDLDTIRLWKNKNNQINWECSHLFTWQPGWKLPDNWNPNQ